MCENVLEFDALTKYVRCSICFKVLWRYSRTADSFKYGLFNIQKGLSGVHSQNYNRKEISV